MTIPKRRTLNVEVLAKAENAPVGSVLYFDGSSVEWVERPDSLHYFVTKTKDNFHLHNGRRSIGEVHMGQTLPPCISCADVRKGNTTRPRKIDVLEPTDEGVYLGKKAGLGRDIIWAVLA